MLKKDIFSLFIILVCREMYSTKLQFIKCSLAINVFMFSGNQASFFKALSTLGTYEELPVPQAQGGNCVAECAVPENKKSASVLNRKRSNRY